jgi:hypothetical protein
MVEQIEHGRHDSVRLEGLSGHGGEAERQSGGWIDRPELFAQREDGSLARCLTLPDAPEESVTASLR